MSKYQQYLICKNRGHQASSEFDKEVVYPKRRCKHCGTVYWTEEKETDVPTPPQPETEVS